MTFVNQLQVAYNEATNHATRKQLKYFRTSILETQEKTAERFFSAEFWAHGPSIFLNLG